MTRKAIVGMVRAAALAAALFVAGGAIPFVGAIAMLFAPAPIMIYAIGRPAAASRVLAAVALAALGVLAAAGPSSLLAYAVSFGLGTLIICYMVEREIRFEIVVLVTSLAVLALSATVAMAIAGSPAALATEAREMLSTAMARGEQLSRSVGMGSVIEPENRARIVELMLRIGPALTALGCAFAVLVNLALFWRWVGTQRLGYRLFGDLVRWSAPEWMVWLLIATGGVALLPAPLGSARTIALNGFVCVGAVYFCQGLAVAAFYLKMLSTPAAWRGLIYFFAAVQPVLAAIVSAVGVFDMWVDFRRLKPPRDEAGNYSDFI